MSVALMFRSVSHSLLHSVSNAVSSMRFLSHNNDKFAGWACCVIYRAENPESADASLLASFFGEHVDAYVDDGYRATAVPLATCTTYSLRRCFPCTGSYSPTYSADQQ